MKPSFVVVSCEHAGNKVPVTFSYLFRLERAVLVSHRGWDIGAFDIAKQMASGLAVKCYHYDYTRLLIESNRSIDSDQLFSEYSEYLDRTVRKSLISTYYKPYRSSVTKHIKELTKLGNRVVHLSIHTFTPVWEGQNREVEIGLLFDEDRSLEAAFCQKVKFAMHGSTQNYQIRYNEPYKGSDDGFTTHLRKSFKSEEYLGVEIEINQKFDKLELAKISTLMIEAVKTSLL
ncbi:MAG: putative N-formylglutamate amidohydrolase [Cyclobacteriaceae bacterium]